MKAYLNSARLAPKKANLVARMVRGMSVAEAMTALRRTHKKGARMIEQLLKSAVANAEHNDKQDAGKLVIKTIVVNQGLGYQRGVPMARGRIRPMKKLLSHISLTLGVIDEEEKKQGKQKKEEKKAGAPSQKPKNAVKKDQAKKHSKDSLPDRQAGSDASDSSISS